MHSHTSAGEHATSEEPAAPFAILLGRDGAIEQAVGSGLLRFGLDGVLTGRSFAGAFADWQPLVRRARRAIGGERSAARVVADEQVFDVALEPREDGGALVLGRAAPGAVAEPYWRLLLSQVPGAIWVTDRRLAIVDVYGNLPAELGTSREQLLGHTLAEFLRTPDPSHPGLQNHLAALSGAHRAFRYRYGARTFEVLMEPRRADDGEIVGVVGAAVDVTERVVAEERLAHSERLLAEAQEVAHVGSFEWEPASNAVTWSPELHRIYGVAPGAFDGTFEAFLRHVHPEDLDRTRGLVLDALRRRGSVTYDHRIVRADGVTRMLHTRASVLGEGGKDRLVGSCWDVTEARQETEERERTVALLRATLDATADGVLVVDRAGHVVVYNERFLYLWNIPRELAEGRDDERLVGHVAEQLVDPEGFRSGIADVYRHPEQETFGTLAFKDGRVFERKSLPYRLGGEVVGCVWSFRDVTERELLLRRALFLADAARLLAWLDVERGLDSVAHLAVPFLGDACAVDLYTEGTPRRLVIVSREPGEYVPTELHRSVMSGHPTIFAVGERSYMAIPLMAHELIVGAITFASSPWRRYTDADLAFAEELGRRATLSLENARLFRGAQEAVRARDEFLAIATHEIRGPIMAIHLAAQSLRSGAHEGPASRQLLDVIEREDRRLSRFVDELLELGRIRSGRLYFEFEEIDLAAVVRDVAGRMGPDFARAGVAVSIASPGPIPGRWDRFRIEQVVTALLGNALKFGQRKPVEVSTEARAGRAILRVRDHGVGIEPSRREHLFDPFGRAVAVRNYGGLGLGLFIARTIVEGLGGSIDVESKPQEGSTFTVELPLERHV